MERLANLAKATQRTKVNEEKEAIKLFEKIAKKAAGASNAILRGEIERKLEDMDKRYSELITRGLADLRHEMIRTDSITTTRINQLEAKVNNTVNRVEEITQETTVKYDQLKQDIVKIEAITKESLETERSKRINMIKKAHEQNKQCLITIEQDLQTMKTDHGITISKLKENLDSQSKELHDLHDHVEEIRVKYHQRIQTLSKAYLNGPSDGNDGQVDSLLQRLQRLEELVQTEGVGGNDSFSYTPMKGRNNNRMPSGEREQDQRPISNQRMRKIEDHLLEIQGRLRDTEDDIQHIKDTVITRIGQSSPLRSRGGGVKNPFDQSFTNVLSASESQSIRDLEKKLKKLAENTTKTCKSLSVGLTDVQQATLSLYTWADKAYDAFEIVANKTSLPSNICPRAKTAGNLSAKMRDT
eukprot:scaffold3058_cov165-Ochromonas_danica.AAC.34